jgi:hypothetical protein
MEKNNKQAMLKTISRIAISVGCLMTISGVVSADTKVKLRQTSGGQTYENTSYIKGKRQRSETNNGQMVMLQQCDLRRNITIMPQAKAYMIQPYDQPATSNAANTNTATTQPGPVKRAASSRRSSQQKTPASANRCLATPRATSSPHSRPIHHPTHARR